MQEKKYYDELNIMRALVIFWVTAGHSFNKGATLGGFLHGYAYTFHMAALFLLSGLLFYKKAESIDSVKSGVAVIKDRFLRLIIPYLFYSAVSYVLKMFFEKYANNKLSSNIIIDLLLGENNPNGGLWFLHTLFVLCVVAVLLCKVPHLVLTGVFFAIKIFTLFVPVEIPVIGMVMHFGFWFFAGMSLYTCYPKVIGFMTEKLKNSKLLYGGCFVLLFGAGIFGVYMGVFANKESDYTTFLICLANIVAWYMISVTVSTTGVLKAPLMVVGNYGMDIYMMGYYVQIAIRVALGSMLGVPYAIYSVLMLILGLLLPIPVSKYIVRKFRITSFVMLGDYKKKEAKNNGQKT
ncbi:MAG: acyltransferase [Eubacterium sp.]|nr:acyltransferase [Eubacterium sp.]